MGNEETGISKEVLHHADEKIKLPIEENTISECFCSMWSYFI
jgi:23S rRNA (guanosine2251-2'-O)-methyltransferase